jgi:Protein of unknown function (DUF4199)
MKRIILKHAGFSSLGLLVLCLLDFFYFYRFYPLEGSFYLLAEHLILSTGIFKTVRSLRKLEIVNFWKLTGAGILVCALAGISAGVFSMLYVQFIDPQFGEKAAAFEKQRLTKLNASSDRIEEDSEALRESYEPGWQVGWSIIAAFLEGIALSFVITTIILGKKTDQVEPLKI